MRRPTIRGLCFVILMLALMALMDSTVRRPLASNASQPAAPTSLQATLAAPEASAGQASIVTVNDDAVVIDMAELGIHPLTTRSSGGKPAVTPNGNAVGRANATLSVSPDVVNQSVSPAFGTIAGNFIPGESVQYYLNGALAGTFAANATGRVAVNINTGAGFGFITIEEFGLTSSAFTAQSVQVDPTGPYLPGVAAVPHAVNTTTGTGTISLYGPGYGASATVTLYRNGVSLGTTAASAIGRIFVNVTPANGGNTSAVYSADAPGVSMAGQSVEERSDAGTPPAGDQNAARAFVDRAVINSTTVTTFILVGEGFVPGESVALTGSATDTLIADLNGAVSRVITSGTGAGIYNFVLTGTPSTRVARASVLAHANVINIRGIIVAPAKALSGSTVTARVDRLPASTTGDFYLDGVLQGSTTTDAAGSASMTLVAPATRVLHTVGFFPAAGGGQSTGFLTFGPTAAPASISGRITTADGAPLAGVTMNLSGARSGRAITDSNGNYRFTNVDTDNFYTVTPALTNYHFGPESRSFSLLANVTDATFTGSLDSVITGNVIDTPEYFVRQHYLDFLGREPDGAGLNFWSNQIRGCGNDSNCLERRTINVSAAYFLSIEFQRTGGLVDALYRASYGRAPLFSEFMPDTATVARDVIVNQPDWEAQLAANTQQFLDAWVERAAFRAAYDNLSNDGYVDALITKTRVTFTDSERGTLVAGLNGGTLTRAQALQRVAENQTFVRAKFNETFVRMQYFGYLRRDPDAGGYAFWLNKLNQFAGNFEQAEMVKAFIVSGEYRARFAQ